MFQRICRYLKIGAQVASQKSMFLFSGENFIIVCVNCQSSTGQDGVQPFRFMGSGNLRGNTVYFTWTHQIIPDHAGLPCHSIVERYDGCNWSTPKKFGRPLHLNRDNVPRQVFRRPGITDCPSLQISGPKGNSLSHLYMYSALLPVPFAGEALTHRQCEHQSTPTRKRKSSSGADNASQKQCKIRRLIPADAGSHEEIINITSDEEFTSLTSDEEIVSE
jgi:hypothetical protein